MSAFIDAPQSCTGLSGLFSGLNGPLRCVFYGAWKGMEAPESLCCLRWAHSHTDTADKKPTEPSCTWWDVQKSITHHFSLTSSRFFSQMFFNAAKKKGGLIVCCGSQNYEAFPPFLLNLSLFATVAASFRDAVLLFSEWEIWRYSGKWMKLVCAQVCWI